MGVVTDWSPLDQPDGPVIDLLAKVIPECRENDIEVSECMPLDTPQHRRAALVYLTRLIWRKRTGRDGSFG